MVQIGTRIMEHLCSKRGLVLSALVKAFRNETGDNWAKTLPYFGQCWLRLPPEFQRLEKNAPVFGELEPVGRLKAVQAKMRQLEKETEELFLPGTATAAETEIIELLTVLRDIADSLFPGVLKDDILGWANKKMGSPAELVQFVTEEYGVEGRAAVQAALRMLRQSKDLKCRWGVIQYLQDTLRPDAVQHVLNNGVEPRNDEKSSLDELFHRSAGVRSSGKFVEAIAFMAKFREYSPFNNMLVYQQNPMATRFATEKDWWNRFGRTVKEDARGMLILAPMTPVLMVYDLDDTEGPPLPEKLEEFAQTDGSISKKVLERTLENARRYGIRVDFKAMGQLFGGFATNNIRRANAKLRIAVREQLPDSSRYSVLCHEMAHILLGHLGGDPDGWWPSRRGLTKRVVEIEAEAVSYIVCRRAGIGTKSPEYLASYTRGGKLPDGVSVDLISRVSAKIESMGDRLLQYPKHKANS